jgi:hypothetical protein
MSFIQRSLKKEEKDERLRKHQKKSGIRQEENGEGSTKTKIRLR